MFDVDNTWSYGKNKNWKKRYDIQKINSLPVISGITTNNGVNYYTDDIPNDDDIFSDSLTISTRGEYSGTVTYHKGKFLLANNILVMAMPNLTLNQKLFIGSLVDNLHYGGYSGYPRKETLKNDIIQLPIKNGEIDFDFMDAYISELEEERISELEEERISELSAYLTVSGLDNYELSSEEKEALERFNLDVDNWKLFKVQDVFYVKSSKKRFDANKVKILNCGFPYIVRMSTNNGIKGYLNQDEQLLNHGNTIAFGQDTATMFYQENPYFTGDKIKILECRYDKFNKINSMFLISAMRKSFSTFSWGANSFSEKVINNQIIQLPTKDNEIDFTYMELLISAVKKLVIKDVVLYADSKIEATKKVVTKN